MQDDAPIVKYINGVLIDAVKKGASDLHFEPYEKNTVFVFVLMVF